MNYRTIVSQLQRYIPRPIFSVMYGTVATLKLSYILYCRYGFLKSAYCWKSIDRSGAPIPWFSYPALEYLDGLDISNMSVFEFGSGYSTLYWCRRVKSLCSAEDNPQWAERVKTLLDTKSSCIRLITAPDEYSASINQSDETYDIIVIDGSDRNECAKTSITRLRNGGMIILDDADHHPEASTLLREANLLQVDFAGFGPINSYTKTTSFFFHREFSPITRWKQLPVHSIGHLT